MTAIDPVCGMTVDTSNPPARIEREGDTVFFCSKECRSEFKAERNLQTPTDRPTPGPKSLSQAAGAPDDR